MTWADRPAALQHRAVGLLLDVDVRFDRHRSPAAHRVDGDLLIVGTAGERKTNFQNFSRIFQIKTGAFGTFFHFDLLLDVDENAEHVLVHLQPLQQGCFAGRCGKRGGIDLRLKGSGDC